jgi:transcriptional regulator with XRE-family HTH domain
MAARVGITRNTLRAVEAGDPAPSIGTYLRVMSALGVSGELALLAGDTLRPPPADSAAARSRRAAPVVQVRVSAEEGRHQLQDLQSLALHEEAVRLVKADPALLQLAKDTATSWLASSDSRSAALWREWLSILAAGAWRKVLGRTRHAQQLRQASPLVTLGAVPPPEPKFTVSMEADIYPLQAPELADQIDGACHLLPVLERDKNSAAADDWRVSQAAGSACHLPGAPEQLALLPWRWRLASLASRSSLLPRCSVLRGDDEAIPTRRLPERAPG